MRVQIDWERFEAISRPMYAAVYEEIRKRYPAADENQLIAMTGAVMMDRGCHRIVDDGPAIWDEEGNNEQRRTTT